ncbi:MAG: DUF4091 domain-containing protein [Clostridia bacterium]|nr:DUF4091 domain-containing protein [Clostridia bacterium]
MKKTISLLLTLLMLVSLMAGAVTTTEGVEDPDIQMWFHHASEKVYQEDVTPTGMDTYSIYMAKNEYQGTQVTLYSPNVTKTNITAQITPFVADNGSGAEMTADVYYEFYIQCTNLDTTDVLGVTDPADSFIKDGKIPDAMAKISDINSRNDVNGDGDGDPGYFTLTAGIGQTLYIKVKSELDTPAGDYTATFNVLDIEGNVLKSAPVHAHVWSFAIPEEGHFQTGIYISRGTGVTEEMYKNYYDYLLDNRICGMNVPGEITSDNEYITNPRVTAFRISDKGSYLGLYGSDKIAEIYTDLSENLENWDTIKEKIYFYVADEPRSQQQKDAVAAGGGSLSNPTVLNVKGQYGLVNGAWGGDDEVPYVLVAIDENHPYPAGYNKMVAYDSATGTYLTKDDGSGRFDNFDDAMQGMMNDNSVTLWCCKTMMFTPKEVTDAVNYDGNLRTAKVKNMNGVISGFDCTRADAQYFDWDTKYKQTFSERFADYQAARATEDGVNVKLWTYECGKGPDYTYCNHLIENTGLQTELLFWQSMQLGATGYLYYGSNLWTEHTSNPTAFGSDRTYDGAMTASANRWQVNKYTPGGAAGTYAYGNGVLFYGPQIIGYLRLALTSKDPLGTIRVELLRDGVEEYEMLYKYGEIYGEEAMQELISKVSANVVDYLSMPGFERSAEFTPDMSDEDVFAAVRIQLGNAVEAGSGYTLTCDGVEIGVYDEGDVVELPVPELYVDDGAFMRFLTWEGADVTRSEYDSANGTANGRTYTIAMPGENVALTSTFVMMGDLNGDSKINAKDIALAKRIISGNLTTYTDAQYEAGDLNCDGKVNNKDLSPLKRLANGNYTVTK